MKSTLGSLTMALPPPKKISRYAPNYCKNLKDTSSGFMEFCCSDKPNA